MFPSTRTILTSVIVAGAALMQLLVVSEARASSFAGPLEPSLRVGPPNAQRFAGNLGVETQSWMERTASWAEAGVVVYDYFVDSQANADELLVLVDGVVQARHSGSQLTGRGVVAVGAGTHTIRFAYKKDGDTDFGLDMAWIDNVRFVAGSSAFAVYSFDTSTTDVITDWTTGGDRGGWAVTFGPDKQGFRRPVSMAFAGTQPEERRAAISRHFSWPATARRNELAISYAVDSEAARDWMQILVDGATAWSKSGRGLRGKA